MTPEMAREGLEANIGLLMHCGQEAAATVWAVAQATYGDRLRGSYYEVRLIHAMGVNEALASTAPQWAVDALAEDRLREEAALAARDARRAKRQAAAVRKAAREAQRSA